MKKPFYLGKRLFWHNPARPLDTVQKIFRKKKLIGLLENRVVGLYDKKIYWLIVEPERIDPGTAATEREAFERALRKIERVCNAEAHDIFGSLWTVPATGETDFVQKYKNYSNLLEATP